jgi:AcrR family transcriptional regulator
VTRRRLETRRRLHEAAFQAFAEDGFGLVSVEQLCERAGYTRGAFYSNFASLDELFLAMWAERSQAMLADLRGVLAAVAPESVVTVRDFVELVARAVEVDDAWYRISAEFTAHALRNPELRAAVAAREETIAATIVPVLEPLLERAGRRVLDRDGLAHALVAVHDGTTAQCLLEPDNPVVRRRRVELLHHVVLAYTEPHTPDNQETT